MRKIFVLLVLFLAGVVFFVNRTVHRIFTNGDRDVSIRVTETSERYELRADYPRKKTQMVQHFMDEALKTNHVFGNTNVDAQVAVDNNINVRVRTRPGYLLLKMNKQHNDSAAYARVKTLEHGLKERLDDDTPER